MNTITPNAARKMRRSIGETFAQIRTTIARARELRKSGHVLDQEEAKGILIMAYWDHRNAQATLKCLRNSRVEKFSNLSTCGADRMARFHSNR